METTPPAPFQPVTGLALRLSLIHGLTFLGIGIAMPFLPLWFAARGMSDELIGIVLTLAILLRMLAVSPVTGLADRHISPVKLMVLLNLATAICYLALVPLEAPFAIALVMGLSALAFAGVVPLSEIITTAQIRAGARIDYGRVRLWGSVTFFAANVAGGYLIAGFGAGAVPWMLAVSAALAALVSLAAPQPPGGPPNEKPPREPAGTTGDGRFTPLFWCVIGGAACVNASHAALYGFGSLHWRGLGYGEATIGYLWAIGIVVELLVFLFGGGVVARGVAGLAWVAFAGVVAALRFTAMAFDPGLAFTFALQALHGVSFGAMHLGIIAALSALAPEGRRAAAQGRLGAVSALTMGAMTLASGFLYARFGSGVFFAMVPVALAGIGLAVLAIWRLRVDRGRGRPI